MYVSLKYVAIAIFNCSGKQLQPEHYQTMQLQTQNIDLYFPLQF